MRSTYQTKWGSDTIKISADFAQAGDIVQGVGGGQYQVAAFHHQPKAAMRRALEECAAADGISMSEAAYSIDEALKQMQEC